LDFFQIYVLTWMMGGAYKPLTNEGGGAASDQRTRLDFLKIAFGALIWGWDASSGWDFLVSYVCRV
jgi:hypothetical protein